MKKIFFFLLTICTILLAVGCKKTDFSVTLNKETMRSYYFPVHGELKSATLSSKEISEEIPDLESHIYEGDITYFYVTKDFFYRYKADTYKLTITDDKPTSYTIVLEGNDQPYNYIEQENIFSVEEDNYYVAFINNSLNENKTLSLDLHELNNFLALYVNGHSQSLYFVDMDSENYQKPTGNSSLVGIDSCDKLIQEGKINGVTLVKIASEENEGEKIKKIVEEYGEDSINSFLKTKKENVKANYIVHNIDDPYEIVLDIDFVPTQYSTIDSEGKKYTRNVPTTYTHGSTGYNEGKMHFSTYTFNSNFPGEYKLTIQNEEESKEYTLVITSVFNYIDANDMFDQKEDRYYVFWLKDGCPGCNSVKPTLLKYAQEYMNLDKEKAYPIYAVHRSQNSGNYFGTPEVFIGVDNIEDFKLGYYPRVLLVENGVITEVYGNIGVSILPYFNDLLK